MVKEKEWSKLQKALKIPWWFRVTVLPIKIKSLKLGIEKLMVMTESSQITVFHKSELIKLDHLHIRYDRAATQAITHCCVDTRPRNQCSPAGLPRLIKARPPHAAKERKINTAGCCPPPASQNRGHFTCASAFAGDTLLATTKRQELYSLQSPNPDRFK